MGGESPGKGNLAELGAILVIASAETTAGNSVSTDPERKLSGLCDLAEAPLVGMEVLGRSVIERTVELLNRYAVKTISIVAGVGYSDLGAAFRHPVEGVKLQTADNPWEAARHVLSEYAERGIEAAFVAKLGAYMELDAEEMLHFHRQEHRAVTRAFDNQGPLDCWLVDCIGGDKTTLDSDSWARLAAQTATYPLRGYVKRLTHPRDLRRLVVDAFLGRCKVLPTGKEIKPRVWVDEGAQVHRRARIVAPAYVGRSSTIREDTVITRCSDVESFCEVDYGTVIEDTSILSNSYVGIWLDVAHAVVCGNKLLNLERDVTLDVTDASMLRKSVAVRPDLSRAIPVEVAAGRLAFAPSE